MQLNMRVAAPDQLFPLFRGFKLTHFPLHHDTTQLCSVKISLLLASRLHFCIDRIRTRSSPAGFTVLTGPGAGTISNDTFSLSCLTRALPPLSKLAHIDADNYARDPPGVEKKSTEMQ